MEYDFLKLNDRDFEYLAADIIAKYLSVRVEKFKKGKDGGVDGRFWIGDSHEGIIQCKHFQKSGYNQLLRKLKSEELGKVKKLKPKRYIFVTSVELSRKNKKDIFALFTPFIQREDDIWGQEDLNQFLLESPDIVENHYKLWITSTTVLKLILNGSIKGRSKNTLDDIKENNYKYVVTENHINGLRLLNEKNVLLISGEPGVGKTMLASNLALLFVANGFEFCDIEESISEAESLYQEEEKKKIVFYFDDFLGSNLYEAITHKKDSHIMKFINRVRKDNTKKLILTSRTTILNSGETMSPVFKNKNIRSDEYLIEVKNLSVIEKAEILYNHIYYSNLDSNFIDVVYKNKRYRDIIEHKNFNPRIVEFLFDNERIKNIKPDEFWELIIKKLENPEDVWADYFHSQADDFLRGLVFLTIFNKEKISELALRNSYNNYIEIRQLKNITVIDKSFISIIKLAIKSLLNREGKDSKNIYYSVFNPSIADFVLKNYLHEEQLVLDIFMSLRSIESLDYLKVLEKNNALCTSRVNTIQHSLLDNLIDEKIENEEWDYLITLANFDSNNPKTIRHINKLLDVILLDVETDVWGDRIIELLQLIGKYRSDADLSGFEFINGFIEHRTLDPEELRILLDFIDKFNVNDESLLNEAKGAVEYFVEEELDDFKDNADLSQYIKPYWSDEYQDVDVDSSGIDSEIEEYIQQTISDFNVDALEKVGFNGSSLISRLNHDDLINYHLESMMDDPDYHHIGSGGYTNENPAYDDIDSIFERN